MGWTGAVSKLRKELVEVCAIAISQLKAKSTKLVKILMTTGNKISSFNIREKKSLVAGHELPPAIMSTPPTLRAIDMKCTYSGRGPDCKCYNSFSLIAADTRSKPHCPLHFCATDRGIYNLLADAADGQRNRSF